MPSKVEILAALTIAREMRAVERAVKQRQDDERVATAVEDIAETLLEAARNGKRSIRWVVNGFDDISALIRGVTSRGFFYTFQCMRIGQTGYLHVSAERINENWEGHGHVESSES